MVMPQASFRLPRRDQRVFICGASGSGKTVFGVHLLTLLDIDTRPWLIVDCKRETLFAGRDMERWFGQLQPGKLPWRWEPGLYITRPRPTPADDAALEEMFWAVWERGRIGVFIDEAYLIKDTPGFRALLTSGRAKQIPMIINSQRPVEVPRWCISEANYYGVFWLNDRRDYKTVEAFIPADVEEIVAELPVHNCLWYDVQQRQSFRLTPAPSPANVRRAIRLRAPPGFW